jgi:hypothetical protein
MLQKDDFKTNNKSRFSALPSKKNTMALQKLIISGNIATGFLTYDFFCHQSTWLRFRWDIAN